MSLNQIINQSIQNTKTRMKMVLKLVVVVAVVVIAIFCVRPYISNFSQSSDVIITTSMVLDKILEISDLSTVYTNYNSIVKVPDPINSEDTLYYISYEATINAGIDFSLVELNLDHEAKTLTITIPESKILETNVDVASLDYIFVDNKSNTETVTAAAYKMCQNDVANESEKIDAIKELAYDNAISVLKALTVPFMQKLGSDYQLVIV